MEKLGKVKNAKISQASINGRGIRVGYDGLVIEFETDLKINDETVVMLLYQDTKRPFYVKEVEISDGKLLAIALECGYWAQKLGRNKELDLRDLIGCEVIEVVNKEAISSIHEQSCWT